ncbi:uncharacterized protein METZ01_LOCUS14549 [marine metagenome]|uniref:Uncharacterized protein n=1 Tax=marine metagenome TaxID=408172 RepID=A0A381P430_9ZZZZ
MSRFDPTGSDLQESSLNRNLNVY